jgi:hypothetical protein
VTPRDADPSGALLLLLFMVSRKRSSRPRAAGREMAKSR